MNSDFSLRASLAPELSVSQSRLALVLLAVALGSSAGAEQIGPRLELPENVYEIGEVEFDEPFSHAFVIRNSGGQDLSIRIQAKSCACVFEGTETQTIPANSQAEILVGYMPENKLSTLGPQSAEIVFSTNDPRSPRFSLRVEANRVAPVFVRPSRLDLGEVAVGSTVRGKFDIVFGATSKNSSLLGVECQLEGLSVDILPRYESESGNSKFWQVVPCDFSFQSEGHIGPIRTSIKLTTNDPRMPLLTVPVSASVKPKISVAKSPLVARVDSAGNGGTAGSAPAQIDKSVVLSSLRVASPDWIYCEIINEKPDSGRSVLHYRVDERRARPGPVSVDFFDESDLLIGRVRFYVVILGKGDELVSPTSK